MYHVIGTRRDKNGRLLQYIAVEYTEFRVQARVEFLDKDAVIRHLRRGNIQNVEIIDGSIRTIGDSSRYLTSVVGRLDEEKSCKIILNKIIQGKDTIGYIVYDTAMGLESYNTNSILRIGEIANARVVEGKYVAPLKGEFVIGYVEDPTFKMMDEDSVVSYDEMANFFLKNGMAVRKDSYGYSVIVPDCGVHLDKVKFGNFLGYDVVFSGGPLSIGEIHMYRDTAVISFKNRGTTVRVLKLDAKDGRAGGFTFMGKMKVKNVYTTSRVRILDGLELGDAQIGLFSVSESVEELRNVFRYHGNSVRVAALDLSRMGEGSTVANSFDLESSVNVKLGKSSVYEAVFDGADTKIILHNFFSRNVRVIRGFSEIQNMERLDFTGFNELSCLAWVDGENIREVILNNRKLEIVMSFNKSNIESLRIQCDVGPVSVSGAFKNTKKIYVESGKYPISIKTYGGIEFSRRINIESSSTFARMPEGNYSGEVCVAEGIRELDLGDSNGNFDRVVLPKSLQKLITERGVGEYIERNVPEMNIGETEVQELPKNLFKNRSFNGKIYMIPDNIKAVSVGALKFKEPTLYYIPSSVKRISDSALNALAIYVHRGSKADKVLNADIPRIYVSSREDVEKILMEDIRDADLAKVKLVASKRNNYESNWGKGDVLARNIYRASEIDRPVNPYSLGVELDRSKFKDVSFEELGEFGRGLKKSLHEAERYQELLEEKSTDQFTLLSNIITNGTEFCGGLLSVEVFEKEIDSWILFNYSDGKDFILTFKLISSAAYVYGVARCIMIIENMKIKYITVVTGGEMLTYINVIMQELGRGAFGLVVEGDYMNSSETIITLGLESVPLRLGRGNSVVTVRRGELLDLASGRFIKYSYDKSGRVKVITAVKEYGEYALDDLWGREEFNSEEDIKVYERINGKL